MQTLPNHKPIDDLTVNYWEARQPGIVGTPENELRLAILRQAVADYKHGAARGLNALFDAQRREFHSARAWLEDAGDTHSFSFGSIVSELLKADPERVRRAIMVESNHPQKRVHYQVYAAERRVNVYRTRLRASTTCT